jgi:hypothetical protein
VVLVLTLPTPTGLAVVPAVALILAPAASWWLAKLLGPRWMPWFYRRPGTCEFSSAGIDLRSRRIGADGETLHINWPEIGGIESRPTHPTIVRPDGSVVTAIPSDLLYLRPVERSEEWTVAQAIVSMRPDDLVLTGLMGVRRRWGDEARSPIEPQPLMSRSAQVVMAAYLSVIFIVPLVRSLLHH